jgi:glycosyltransferase involved in cell wall biosynthesis
VDVAPKISVIIPAYNVEEYLDETLQSVADQTFKDFEAVIINDGSTDSTEAIAKAHAKKDKRFKVFSQKNKGLSESRNRGVRLAKGKYIYYLDADDLITNNTFDVLYKSCEANGADMAVQPYIKGKTAFKGTITQSTKKLFESPEQEVNAYANPNILLRVAVWGKLMKRDFLLETGATFVGGMIYEDLPYSAELYCKARKIIAVEAPMYWYRERFDNSALTANRITVQDVRNIRKSMLITLNVIKKYGNMELYVARFLYFMLSDFKARVKNSCISDYEYYQEVQKTYTELMNLWRKNTNEELPAQLLFVEQLYKTENQELLRKFFATMSFNDEWLFVDNVDDKPAINLEKTFFEPDKIGSDETLYSVIDKTKTYYLQNSQTDAIAGLHAVKRNGDEVVCEGHVYLTRIDPAKFKYDIEVTATPPNRKNVQIPIKFEQVELLEATRVSPERTFNVAPLGFRVTSNIKDLEQCGTWFSLNFTISAAGFTKNYSEKVWIAKFSDFKPNPSEKISNIKITKIDLKEDALTFHLQRCGRPPPRKETTLFVT